MPIKLSEDREVHERAGRALLLIGVMLSGTGQTVIFAILPPLARDLGLADIQVGTIFTLSAILFTVLAPVWGRMSDTRGRRPFIVFGLLGFSISMVAFGVVLDLGAGGFVAGLALYAALILARSLSGAASAATSAAGLAYIADHTPPERRAAGLASFTAAYGLGSVLGPAAAGLLSVVTPTFPLYLLAALGLLASLSLFIWLPRTTRRKPTGAGARLGPRDGRIRRLLGYALIGGCIAAIPVQVIGFFLLDAGGVARADLPRTLGLTLSLFAGASLTAQLGIARRAALSPGALLRLGPALALIGAGIVALSPSLPAVLAGMAVLGAGSGLVAPAAIAAMSMRVENDEQGGASGMAGSAGAIGFIAAPFVGFGLHALDPHAPFVLLVVLAALLVLPYWHRAPQS